MTTFHDQAVPRTAAPRVQRTVPGHATDSRPPRAPTTAVRQPSSVVRQAPRLLDQVRLAMRTRHMSPRTEEAYLSWIRRFILFHRKRHPGLMGEPEITSFLSHLAVVQHVSASTQNQALAALLFLYQRVLNRELAWLAGVVHAKRPDRLPVVLSRDEVKAVLERMQGAAGLMGALLYGSGLRLLECGRGVRSPLDVRAAS